MLFCCYCYCSSDSVVVFALALKMKTGARVSSPEGSSSVDLDVDGYEDMSVIEQIRVRGASMVIMGWVGGGAWDIPLARDGMNALETLKGQSNLPLSPCSHGNMSSCLFPSTHTHTHTV